jgi:hypothetical protein
MPNSLSNQLPQVVTFVAILTSCGMASLLLKTPHGSYTYLVILTPFIFLFGFWACYLNLSKALQVLRLGQLKTGDAAASVSVEESAGIVAIFGLVGIAIALFMGFILGRMPSH